VFRNEVTIDYREAAVDTVLRAGRGSDLFRAKAESDAREQRLAAERAVDSVLADSFPASDPPSWTLGITHPQPGRHTTHDETAAPEDSPDVVREGAIDVSRPATAGRTFLRGLASLAGAAGIALLVPFAILLRCVVCGARGVSGLATACRSHYER
jgi:hypothetical protein